MRRVHPLTYRVAPHDLKRLPKLHQRRDLCAGMELKSVLTDQGYGHGEPIFTQPPLRGPQKPRDGRLFKVDLSFVDPEDILLHFTRPPIDDISSGPKRKIARAYTDLEQLIFEAWKSHFLAAISRNHILVHPEMHPLFERGFEYCREMTFKQKGWGAPFDEVNAQEGGGWRKCNRRTTALFLLRLEELWPGGPGYLGAFGMDGCTTLVWSYRLARDLRHLMEEPGFVVAELELGTMPEHPTNLRWSMEWKIVPVLVKKFGCRPKQA